MRNQRFSSPFRQGYGGQVSSCVHSGSGRTKEVEKMKRKSKKYWSGYVTKHSFALELESGVFTWKNPKRIAASLKRSAEESENRKGTPFQSAMSMLNFYINRAGKNLPRSQKKILEQAKIELRKVFSRS